MVVLCEHVYSQCLVNWKAGLAAPEYLLVAMMCWTEHSIHFDCKDVADNYNYAHLYSCSMKKLRFIILTRVHNMLRGVPKSLPYSFKTLGAV